ncbi:MAG: YihY/virulence factor BrkB family protein [Actinomycetota bacterium]|nr:YihY/virulence factor BrkB family protein [Actinomycetota bacterium]
MDMPGKERGFGAAWRAVRRRGGGEIARSSVKRLRETDGASHVRALAYQSMFVLLSGFIGLVGLASALDLPRVRGIVEHMAETLSPGPSGQLLREAARQGATGGTTAMVLGLLAALLAGTLAMAQVERSANRLAGRTEDRPFGQRYGVAFVLSLSAGVLLAAGGLALAGGRAISEGLGWGGAALTVWNMVRWPLGVAVAAIGIYLLFRMAPRERIGSRAALAAGTAASVALWCLFSLALGLYFSLSSNAAFGPLLSVIALLLWSSLSSLALHLGLAVTTELALGESRSGGLVRVPESEPERSASQHPSARSQPAKRTPGSDTPRSLG